MASSQDPHLEYSLHGGDIQFHSCSHTLKMEIVQQLQFYQTVLSNIGLFATHSCIFLILAKRFSKGTEYLDNKKSILGFQSQWFNATYMFSSSISLLAGDQQHETSMVLSSCLWASQKQYRRQDPGLEGPLVRCNRVLMHTKYCLYGHYDTSHRDRALSPEF